MLQPERKAGGSSAVHKGNYLMDIIREKTCCFTGHRPEKLHESEGEVIYALRAKVCHAIEDGFDTFITGMSRGVDIWAAEIVLELKRENPEIRLVAALPYDGMGNSWNSRWKNSYFDILEKADLIKIFSPNYQPFVYGERDRWMVDMSSRVIAVYHGEAGGTKNTMDYAEKNGIEVIEC